VTGSEGRWITVKGRHIFIENGESVDSALEKVYENYKKSPKTPSEQLTDNNKNVKIEEDKQLEPVKSNNEEQSKKQLDELKQRIKADTEGKMTIEEIVNDPAILEAEKKFSISAEEETYYINTPERDKMRHEKADEINKRGSISGKNEFNGEVKKEFRAEIVIGAPAGGKSSVIVDKVSKNTGSRVLDSDEIKALLPEFDNGNGAGKVHKESADIVLENMVIPEYYKGGKCTGDNIVIPIVGKSTRAANLYLQKLKEAGYTVHLSFNDVTPLNSMKRAVTRYAETGRFLSPKYLQSVGTKPKETYEQLKKEQGFDTYSYYDNNVAFGEPAKKVEKLDKNGNKLEWEDWQ
jgi:hypothetical protein